MKKIRQYLVKKCKLLNSKSPKPYVVEFTVFIRVKIEILSAYSNSIWEKLNKIVKQKSEKIKIKTAKKYLLISSKLKFILVNKSLFIKTFLGLLNDKI